MGTYSKGMVMVQVVLLAIAFVPPLKPFCQQMLLYVCQYSLFPISRGGVQDIVKGGNQSVRGNGGRKNVQDIIKL